MKKLFWRAWTAAVVLTALCSCAEEALEGNNRLRTETITADMPEDMGQPGTRTCIDLNSSDNGTTGLLWQSTDTIGVYGQQGITCNAPFACQATTNQAQATFSGQVAEGDPSYRAYYPYSAENNGVDIDNLRGCLPKEQPFDLATGKLTGDYKYGAPVGNTKRFTFRHLFSMLRVSVDAKGTNLEGDYLDRIILSVKDAQGNPRGVCGSFTFSARDGSWDNLTDTSDCIVMPWTSAPQLISGKTYQGFITILPRVKKYDRITITVLTDNHKAEFTAPCLVDFEAENIYNIPLTLKGFNDNAEKFGYTETELPTITSFGFKVDGNKGKLLNNKLVWNSSNNPEFNNVTEYTATIKGSTISHIIPYLYDFKLKPTFTVSKGSKVYVGEVEQKSGETEVDFTRPVTYTVKSGDVEHDYTVSITNTGLPVVVIQQSQSGDFKEVTTGGLWGIGAKTVNKFVDFMVRGKDTEWVEDDQMTIYNADGTVDLATANCGVRLRGNTSQAYPKKPLAVKFKDKQAVLGMPKHKRWVLLANWLDHSMIRNSVAFDLAHLIEQAWKNNASIGEGIPWNVHGQNVELVIDGHHVGNYYLCEQIKIGSKRLDINDAYEDVKADGLVEATLENCGYLLELDNNYDENYKFITSHYSVPFMFKDDVLDDGIFNQVKSKIQGIEDNIYNGNFKEAYNDLDINSVVDQWFIWELTMNHEFLDPRSVYYFMNGNGKLCAGPVWDFDRATFQNVTNAKNQGSSGDRLKPYDEWICWSANPKSGLTSGNLDNGTSCIFYPALIKDPIFQAKVKERWAVMYPVLMGLEQTIRAYGKSQAVSFLFDSAMWPTNKAAIQKHKNNFSDWSGDENINSYPELIENFVTVYRNRLNGMNTLITSGRFTK